MTPLVPPHFPRAWRALEGGLVAAMLVLGGCNTVPAGRIAVNEVRVRGAKALDEGDIRDRLVTAESQKFLGLFRGILFEYSFFDDFVLQRDLARVEAFYRSKGYYDARARAGRLHRIDDEHVRVEILVEEGAPVLVVATHVDGLDGVPPEIADHARRAATAALPTGKPLVDEHLAKAEGDVRRALTDRGYAYAKVDTDAAVDVVAQKVVVAFLVTPGPKCVFGPARIEGLGSLPEAPVRRAIDIDPGDPYSEASLEEAQQALLDLGVFAAVELTPEDPLPPRHLGGPTVVPLVVKVEPSRLRTVRLGGGIELDALKTDLHAVIGWGHRNLFGGLRSFSVSLRPGVVLYPLRVNNFEVPTHLLPEERLRMEFKQPGFIEARTSAVIQPELNLYPLMINPDPPPADRVVGYAEIRNAAGLERRFWKFDVTLSHNTQVEFPFSYVGEKDPTLGSVVISYPELYTTFDFRDDKVRPRKGFFIANTLQVAGHVFGGDASDYKVQPEVCGYVPLSKSVVFAARASIGLLQPRNYGAVVRQPSSTFEPAPSLERTRDYQLTFFRGFSSGGPTSNRGYPIRGVGPHDFVPFLTPDIALARVEAECGSQCRTPTGGFTLWEASAELRVAVGGPISVATFCDASDVSPQTNDFRFDHPHLSCGGGGRYDTPVGPIRVDVGYRLPGLQVIGGLTPDEQAPSTFVAGIPIAVHVGIGEAY